MKKSRFSALNAVMVVGVLSVGQLGSAMAADITVCPVGGIECDFTTVEAGIAAAASGDRVVVGTLGRITPETYITNIQMKAGVDLVSEGDDSLVLYSDPYGKAGFVTFQVLERATLTILQGAGATPVVTFDSVGTPLLDGFIIEHVDATAPDMTALIEVNDSSPTISNNIVRDNQGPAHNQGIHVAGGMSMAMPLIQNNVIHYTNGAGVAVHSNAYPTISDNNIFTTPPSVDDYAPGIGMRDDSSALILNNIIFRNGGAGIGTLEYGIRDNGMPIIIRGNTIHSHTFQAGMRFEGQTGEVDPITIVVGGPNPEDSNELYNNRAGIRIKHPDSSARIATLTVENNNFHRNAQPLYIQNVSTLTAVNNQMVDNYLGCAARILKTDNVIFQGNYIDDSFNCAIRIMYGYIPVTLLIEDNYIANGGYSGIQIDNRDTTGTISGNHVTQNARGGIVITARSTLDIIDNEVDHNLRAGMHSGDDDTDGYFAGGGGSLVATVRGNKVHHNGQDDMGAGIDLRHADGVIENNLIYKNNFAGIRFGNWVDSITHNTIVANGTDLRGGGIVYDNLAGEVGAEPEDAPAVPILIRNNILVANARAGINAGTRSTAGATCDDWIGYRDYNLYSANNGTVDTCADVDPMCWRKQIALCWPNGGEIFVAPEFVDAGADDYRLQIISPAVDAADPAFPDDGSLPPGVGNVSADMGAYGGPHGIDW